MIWWNTGLSVLIVVLFYYMAWLHIELDSARALITAETKKKVAIAKSLEEFTDPEKIDAELERSARRREAFDSKMPYPPRDDSGPPAVIHTARLGKIKPKPKIDG
jgi:hypothetical protein